LFQHAILRMVLSEGPPKIMVIFIEWAQ